MLHPRDIGSGSVSPVAKGKFTTLSRPRSLGSRNSGRTIVGGTGRWRLLP